MTKTSHIWKRVYIFAATGLIASAIGISLWPASPPAAVGSGTGNPTASIQPAVGTVRTSVLEDTGDRIVLKYELGSFTEETVRIGRENYTSVHLGREALMRTHLKNA